MTNAIVVRYRTRAGAAETNAQLVRDVYDELAAHPSEGFHYMTLQLDDGVSFVHVAIQDDETESPLTKSDAFARFQAGLPDRVEQGPEPRAATLVGAHAFGLDDK
jgi:hypothetical protein